MLAKEMKQQGVSAWKRRTLALMGWAACLLLLTAGTAAFAQRGNAIGGNTLSVEAITWAKDNLDNYHSYQYLAKNIPQVQIPVPLLVDPPCRLCGKPDTDAQLTAPVAAWVTQSEEPELSALNNLVKIGNELAEWNKFAGTLSPSAQRALKQYNAAAISDMEQKIAFRLFHAKALQMAQKYNSDPKSAYAGISFLVQVGKDAWALSAKGVSIDSDTQQQYSGQIRTWVQSISDKIDSDALAGHQYNQCPVYLDIYRLVNSLGTTVIGAEQIESITDKMQKQLRFDVSLYFHVVVTGKGSQDVTWTGKAKLRLNLDGSQGCYAPELEGGKMAMTVENFSWVTDRGETVKLTSPRSFDMPLGLVQLSLCDKQPLLQLPLTAGNIPLEEITVGGNPPSKTPLLSSYLPAMVLSTNISKSASKNPSQSSENDVLSPLGPPNTPEQNASDADLKSLQAKLAAHKGDKGWIMSPEGQSVIAQMEQAALALEQSKLASVGLKLPAEANATSLSESVASVQLNWSNGQAQPANTTFPQLVLGNGKSHFLLRVQVDQAEQ